VKAYGRTEVKISAAYIEVVRSTDACRASARSVVIVTRNSASLIGVHKSWAIRLSRSLETGSELSRIRFTSFV